MTILADAPPIAIRIGQQGENDAASIAVDWSTWAEQYGAGILDILLQRPGDAGPYPVETATDGTVTIWTPSSTDTAVSGSGKAQLVYRVGGVVAKSAVVDVRISPSLGEAADPPEPWQSWVDQVLEAADAAEESATAAEESAEAAQEAAQSIKSYTFAAEGGSITITEVTANG